VHQNQNENPSQKAQEGRDWFDSKAQRAQGGEGTRRIGSPFPIKSNTNFHKPMDKSTLKRETGGGEHRGGGLEKQRVHEQITKAALDLTQVKGYLYPRDRSDRYAGPVRPVG